MRMCQVRSRASCLRLDDRGQDASIRTGNVSSTQKGSSIQKDARGWVGA
jgi:hypothetical protein